MGHSGHGCVCGQRMYRRREDLVMQQPAMVAGVFVA